MGPDKPLQTSVEFAAPCEYPPAKDDGFRVQQVDQVDQLLNRQSGLKGLSGISGDFRELEDAASK